MEWNRGSRGESLEERAAQLLAGSGWHVIRSSRAGAPDFVISKGGLRYVAEMQVARDARRPVLEGRLADAVLRASAYARRFGPGAQPLAIVAAPILSEGMVEALRAYAREFAPEIAFALIDEQGRFEFKGQGLGGLAGAPNPRPRESVEAPPSDLFSDLNQWMLKVLLGRYLPNDVLAVPRGAIRGPADLSRLAKTSVPSAWRFLTTLTAAGFAEESSDGIELVRREELLLAWLSATKRPVRERRAALAVPVKVPLELLGPRVATYRSMDRRIAWGTFVAAAPLIDGAIRNGPLHLYVDDIGPTTLERLGLLAATESQRAHIVLRKPRWPESLFRAVTTTATGQPTTDIIQCWLDLTPSLPGEADPRTYLWRRVLAPALGLEHLSGAP